MDASTYNNLHGPQKLSTVRAQCTSFLYFPLCCAGFSPGIFLSNFPPLAVAVAAMPDTLPNSSLVTFLGAASVKAAAAN